MFEVTLKKVLKKLEKAQTAGLLESFALIGGLAVSRWSIPRATADIDLIVALGDSKIEALAEFLGGEYLKGDIRDPLRSSISFELKDKHGPVPIQILEFPKSWEKVAFQEISLDRVGDITLPIVHWKALVLLKLYAGSPLDLQDAQNILATVSPRKKELASLKKKAATLRVSNKLEKIL